MPCSVDEHAHSESHTGDDEPSVRLMLRAVSPGCSGDDVRRSGEWNVCRVGVLDAMHSGDEKIGADGCWRCTSVCGSNARTSSNRERVCWMSVSWLRNS